VEKPKRQDPEVKKKLNQRSKEYRDNWTQDQIDANNEGRRRNYAKKAQQAAEIAYPVLNIYPAGGSTPMTTTETTPDCGLSIIVCGRFSNRDDGDVEQVGVVGNEIILQKFVADFIDPIPVLALQSSFWNGRKCWAPLPYFVADVDDDIEYAEEEGHNRNADARFCTFFDSQPEGTQVIILIRGIDGCSTDAGSWIFLKQRYPKLHITLVFSCLESYVRNREPENDVYFYRTAPFDGRLYGVFHLDQIVSTLLKTTFEPKYQWLVREWKQAKIAREVLSEAYLGGEEDEISNAYIQFRSLCSVGRNALPILAGH
jgi:hypothetical protein